MSSSFDVAVVGDWHLAFCTAACLASTGKRVALVNQSKNLWQGTPALPVREPGLQEMIDAAVKAGKLQFINSVSEQWQADCVWLAVDTPVDENDQPDLSPLLTVLGDLRRCNNVRKVLAVSSQVPVGFGARVQKEFNFSVAYVPENLRLGHGIATFKEADRTVIGADKVETREAIKTLMVGFKTEFLLCDLITAEMVKHATNIFLATSISFANELARVGERLGVDNQLVGKALKMDKRIGAQAYVAPGLGFAGGTLPRDLRVLQKIGKSEAIPTPLVDAVLQVNEATALALVDSVRGYLGDLRGKRVLIVGYTYKAETDTLRRSASLEMAEALGKAGAEVWGYDHEMNTKDLSSLNGVMRHFAEWKGIPVPPDAIVLMTPRPAFRELAWAELVQRSPHAGPKPLLLDARALLDAGQLRAAGYVYKSLWQPLA